MSTALPQTIDHARRREAPAVHVRGLRVALPSGLVILRDTHLTLRWGSVTSLLGPSGGGKTTLLRAIFSPAELQAKGYEVEWAERDVVSAAAFVPQRGALVDHLDVLGNLELARAAGKATAPSRQWLDAVGIDAGFDARAVHQLSGGQVQRVAVARALAAGGRVLVLDEPSVGLDPLGVRRLAKLLIEQARQHHVAIVIVTHDLTLAAGASDDVLFLDTALNALCSLSREGEEPAELLPEDERARRVVSLERRVVRVLERAPPPAAGGTARFRWSIDPLGPLRAFGEGLVHTFRPTLFVESSVVFSRALLQSMLRPALFYVIVGALLGYTIPFVVAHISSDFPPKATLSLLGGSYVLALAPPLSAIVFAATSGSAIAAWLGGMRLHGQVVALEGLGVSSARYLWAPSWMALTLSYLFTMAMFVAAMILGGWVLFDSYAVPHALDKLTSDFLDPPPARVRYLVRAAFLVVSYAVSIASVAVWRGQQPKDRSDQVTASMTSSVMISTLLVVALELGTVVALYALSEAAP